MVGATCIIYPQVNGKDSEMYKDLLKKIKDRPQVNWIYANYIASNTKQAMEAAGYKANKQGENNASDLLKFLNYSSIQKDMKDLTKAAQQIGAMDKDGKLIDFTDAKEALDKADDFNNNHTGLVATVYQHGDIFNIYISEKNSRTHMQPTEVKEKLAIWDVYKQAFNGIGVDIETLPQSVKAVFNANNPDIVGTLINIKGTSNNYLFPQDALILFYLNQKAPIVQRLISAFSSLEDAAAAIDGLRQGQTFNAVQKRLLKDALDYSKNFQGLDLTLLQDTVSQMSDQVKSSSSEENIEQTLTKLKKQYNIEINELNLIKDRIDTLSEAAGEAALQIKRKIRELEKSTANNAEGKRLEGVLNQLMKELQYKKYYTGVLNFLKEAQAIQAEVSAMISSTPQIGTELERLFQDAKTLMNIKQIKEQYYPVIDALASDSLRIDESISQTDIDNMRAMAKDLKTFFDEKEKSLNERAESIMEGILMEIVGDEAPDGQTIANLVKMAQKDTSIMNYLYSVGRSSSPVISTMGAIIARANEAKNDDINEISRRIRRATDKLFESGSNSEFMYEDDGVHIISDIDWNAYEDALKKEKKNLARQGLKGFDFKIALDQWIEDNTEEREVDKVSHRTERVPDAKYRKAFPKLTAAQQEYYDEMMQIKGELGTMLPAYAQNHYLAPQIRRTFLDAILHAKNARDVLKAIKNKLQNLYKIREDDTNYAGQGIIEGEEYKIAYGSYDNKKLREIPIFYINKVEQGEILKEFSTGLQHLASTAVNYKAMNDIEQVVEFIGDFAKGMPSRADVNEADIVQNQFMKVSKGLYAWGQNTNTAALIDGYISQHLYGEKRAPNDLGNKTWQKLADNIIGYTSFKGLATNVKGALSNYLVGEFQMLIEAGAGEFYGLKDYRWAHGKLFGKAGVAGEIMEMVTNNMNSKGTLFRELFDPIQENFSDKSHQRYSNSWLRQLINHDCSFIGYASGEFLIHYVNMYAILHNQKVLLNGKKISLYDAFEVGNKQDGNSELVLKAGVTKLDGSAVDAEYLKWVKGRIKYANQSTHGAMNEEDKGLIHRYWMGRMAMNFRQWAVEHYSRRFRGAHFDASLGETREGYWYSLYEAFKGSEGADEWGEKNFTKAIGLFMRDLIMFTFRAQSQWSNLNDMQRYNIKRAHSELLMYIMLCGLSFALGEPDEHKRDFWRRWWIYQVKRLEMEAEAAMPHPKAVGSILNILQSPMAGVSTMNSMMYIFYGLSNGDLFDTIKSGPHKGENRYLRNVKKNVLPFFKDWEQLQNMDTSDAVFQVFDVTASNR